MRSITCPILVLLAALGAGLAHAGDEPADASVALALDATPGVAADEAPRLVRTDLTTELPRSLPGYRSELTALSYRWWVSSGRADFGLGLGALTYAARPIGNLPGLPGDGASLTLASGTILTLGMRYRASERAALFADASGVRGPGLDGGDAVVGKVGVEFKAAQSRWNIAYGGLGLRLAGDTNVSLRLRRGGLGVQVHRAF